MQLILLMFFFFLSSWLLPASAQSKLYGRVFDSTGLHPVESVSVQSSSGKGTVTNKEGRYEIIVDREDSVWFSYLGKSTIKYSAQYALAEPEFVIALKVNVVVLNEVRIRTPDRKLDSINNRLEYRKIFNYKRPTFSSIVTSYGLGFTVDIDELVRAFQKKKIRSALSFRERLIEEERNKYVDYRFNRVLVKQLTNGEDNRIAAFMKEYRPSYNFVKSSNDYELRVYILQSWKKFLAINGRQ